MNQWQESLYNVLYTKTVCRTFPLKLVYLNGTRELAEKKENIINYYWPGAHLDY